MKEENRNELKKLKMNEADGNLHSFFYQEM